MVMLRSLLLFCLLFFTGTVCAQDAKVAVDVDQGTILENQPIRGTISITHKINSKIDVNTFKMGNKVLVPQLLREVPVGTDSILSLYRFETTGQAKGLYLLPAVTVSVDGSAIKSPMTSYEVQGGGNYTPQQTPDQSSSGNLQNANANPNSQAALKLEAYIDGSSKIFPGERTRLAYKITYSGSIDLKEEVLPLLKPDGLRKIGDIDTKEDQKGDDSLLIISQLVEGIQPGDFKYGPSHVSGAAYVVGPGGNKAYLSPDLRSEAPPVTIVVLPFPGTSKPASFNGAIGPLTMDVKLQSPSKVNVGDKVTLIIDISGDTILENLQPPDVCCQPGFSGLFKASDLPPQASVKGKTKTFIIDLWPLSKEIKAIPPIEYTYFDPSTSKYVVLKSKPIPLNVLPVKQPEAPATAPEKNPPPLPTGPIKTQPIEIQSIYSLECSDLHNTWLGTWEVFALIPIGAILLLFQHTLYEAILRKKNQIKVKSSQDLLKEAQAQINNPKLFFPLLNQALITWLKEKGEIQSTDILPEPETLPDTGFAGSVKKFLSVIQEQRFTGKDDLPRQDLLNQAQKLMQTPPSN